MAGKAKRPASAPKSETRVRSWAEIQNLRLLSRKETKGYFGSLSERLARLRAYEHAAELLKVVESTRRTPESKASQVAVLLRRWDYADCKRCACGYPLVPDLLDAQACVAGRTESGAETAPEEIVYHCPNCDTIGFRHPRAWSDAMVEIAVEVDLGASSEAQRRGRLVNIARRAGYVFDRTCDCGFPVIPEVLEAVHTYGVPGQDGEEMVGEHTISRLCPRCRRVLSTESEIVRTR